MIETDLEKSNKCSFAESNSINYNSSMFNTCLNTAISLATNEEPSSIIFAKCSSQRPVLSELPKNTVSSAKVSTYLSYRSIKETFSRRYDSNHIRSNQTNAKISVDNYCKRQCVTSFKITDCKERKKKDALLNHNKNDLKICMPFLRIAKTAIQTKLYNSSSATSTKSIFLPSYKHSCGKSHTTPEEFKHAVKSYKKHTFIKQKHSFTKNMQSTPLISPKDAANFIEESKENKIKTATFSRCKAFRLRFLPDLKVTSIFSLFTLICLETVLLSTVSNCAKTFYMHWNTSNSIFRIDNTDHIIDVNKGNLAFEFDQVHIICPVYEPGTYENETEKYIIYNVSKVEYETCRITNADPRVIAICDKPQKLMFFTITFRPFTPQPGGLEFLPGNDYYFISTSSKDDLYRRIGGRCSTNNMKVVFKVCCAPQTKINKTMNGGVSSSGGRNTIGTSFTSVGIMDAINNVGGNDSGGTNAAPTGNMNQQHINGINTGLIHGGAFSFNNGVGVIPKTHIGSAISVSGTSINTNTNHFKRIHTQANSVSGISKDIGLNNEGSNGVLMSPGVLRGVGSVITGDDVAGIEGQFSGHQQSGIRINTVPSLQQHPSVKNRNADDHPYNKHPNEVVKNEELTYNSASTSLHYRRKWKISTRLFETVKVGTIWKSLTSALSSLDNSASNNIFKLGLNFKILDHILKVKDIFCTNINPLIIISLLLSTFVMFACKYQINFRLRYTSSYCQNSLSIISIKSSFISTSTDQNSSRARIPVKMSIENTIAKYHLSHALSSCHNYR